MGLLDEAIREHLELKRRRGADPSEVAREEHEALGPARRTEPIASPGGDGTAAAGAGGAYALGDGPLEGDAGPSRAADESGDAALEDDPHVAVPFGDADDLAPADGPEDDAPRRDDDVLDRTPEFLEETPEHDRLWFEQRPPRDFDFDG